MVGGDVHIYEHKEVIEFLEMSSSIMHSISWLSEVKSRRAVQTVGQFLLVLATSTFKYGSNR